MYSVKVRDSIMIAHSLNDPLFGPAQNLHGATFTVDVEFFSATTDAHNVVVDISRARDSTKQILATLNYRNLDEIDAFAGQLTTAEFVARHIHDEVAVKCAEFFSGAIKVTLRETHDAWVSYDGRRGGDAAIDN